MVSSQGLRGADVSRGGQGSRSQGTPEPKRAGVAPEARPGASRLSGPRLPRAADAQALPVNEGVPPAEGGVQSAPTGAAAEQRFFLEDRGREAHKFPDCPEPNGRLLYISY